MALNFTFLHNKIAVVEHETKEEILVTQYLIDNNWKLTVAQNEESQNPQWILKQIKPDGTMVTLSGTPKTYFSKFCLNPILGD